jgi:Ca2+-binding RTX toxin-like protein
VGRFGASGIYDREPISRNDTITGGLEADTLTGGAGVNVFQFDTALAADGEFGDLATGDVDVITDFKKASLTADGDVISFTNNPNTVFSTDSYVAGDWDDVLGTLTTNSQQHHYSKFLH